MLRWLASLVPRRPLPASPRQRALALLRSGDAVAAEVLLSELLAGESALKERAFLFNKRGVARIAQGHGDTAAEDFAAALACDAHYVPAIVNVGNAAFEAARVDEALQRFEEAMELDPSYARAHAGAAAAYKRLGRYAEAVRALRAAQRLRARGLTFWRASRRS